MEAPIVPKPMKPTRMMIDLVRLDDADAAGGGRVLHTALSGKFII
jgi:hypothetical protein